MQNLAILGAGRSAGYLIHHLATVAVEKNWNLIVYDQDFEGYFSSFGRTENCHFKTANLSNYSVLEEIVQNSDIIVSVLPPSMHFAVARFCVLHQTHLVTASYISPEMRALGEIAREKNVILLNELGLDPGIDHLSAAKAISEIQSKGGEIVGFESHCGGLISENDCNGNPWKYKFTWNPRNVVLAGQGGKSKWLENGIIHEIDPSEVFNSIRCFELPNLGKLEAYPNRDSLSYIEQYNLSGVKTMFRGTLRRVGYCNAWQVLVKAGFANDEVGIDKQFANRKAWFKEITHCDSVDEWLNNLNISQIEIIEKIKYLELDNANTSIIEGLSYAAALQQILQEKWKLSETDKDEVLMVHKIDYFQNGEAFQYWATLRILGEGGAHTAMAKTVGLPLALGAIAIMEGKIQERGCLMPFNTNWGLEILQKLDALDIHFEEILQRIHR